MRKNIVKLVNPTQLQLVGVEVDFDFPRKEGRKKKEEPAPSF